MPSLKPRRDAQHHRTRRVVMLWFDRFQDIQSQVETQPNQVYAQLCSIFDTFATKTVFTSPQANGFHYLWAAVLLYEVLINLEQFEEARQLTEKALESIVQEWISDDPNGSYSVVTECLRDRLEEITKWQDDTCVEEDANLSERSNTSLSPKELYTDSSHAHECDYDNPF